MDISAVRHPQPSPHVNARPISEAAKKAPHALDLRSIKPIEVKPAATVVTAKTQRVTPKATSRRLDEDRLSQAKQIQRSEVISRFGANHSGPTAAPAVTHPKPAIVTLEEPTLELPPAAVTHHEALVKLMETTKYDAPPLPKTAANTRGRVAATLAAVMIMGGYIWLQNYPKMAVQSASSRSGISASLPGYLPSSYSLAGTDVRSGLVTLSFKSPSQPEQLTIKQDKTNWDSASLLDNYVTTTANEYSAVQQQGLTVYLMNNNVATWVNHGIWYTISGTGRLSREQILKIAYSL